MTEAQLIERFDAFSQPCTKLLGNGRVTGIDPKLSKDSMEFVSTPDHCHSGMVVQDGVVAALRCGFERIKVVNNGEIFGQSLSKRPIKGERFLLRVKKICWDER